MTTHEAHDPLKDTQKLMELLEELLAELPVSEAEIDRELRAAGYDPAAFTERIAAAVADALAASPLNWRNRAAQLAAARAQLDALAPPASAGAASERGTTLDAIRQLMSQLGQRATPAYAHFRNFEVVTDEDLASLLAELRYLADQDDEDRDT